MAATESTQILPLGEPAPAFALPDVTTGDIVSLEMFLRSRALVVTFASPHCPYVKHVQAELKRIADEYIPRGVAFIVISSNDAVAYPDDRPEALAAWKQEQGFAFPVLYDETQDVARLYHAACTPDFFVFDGAITLAYRGQLDDSRPKNDKPVTGRDLRATLDAILAGEPVSPDQRPSIGCNIKWKA